MTVKEWMRFAHVMTDSNGNFVTPGRNMTFVNFFTGKREILRTVTGQEVLLSKYRIILDDHVTRKHVWVTYPEDTRKHLVRLKPEIEIPVKEKLKQVPRHINQENFDKGLKALDKGLKTFDKMMSAFSSGLGQTSTQKKQNLKNIESIFGSLNKGDKSANINGVIWGDRPKKKSKTVKIWGDPPRRKTRKSKRSKSVKLTKDQENLKKIWG